jgi:hypothetical protein
MHQYQIGLKFYGPQMADDYDDSLMLDETCFTLLDLEKELLQGIVYTYDLGDNWEHVIMLEKVIPESEGATFPILLDGGRECPPEDIGGIPGYQYFLEALADPNHEEHEELSNLPGLQGYDPDHVAKDAVNHLLQTVYGKK